MTRRPRRYCQNCYQADGHAPTCLLAIREANRAPRDKTPRKTAHDIAEDERALYAADLLDLITEETPR